MGSTQDRQNVNVNPHVKETRQRPNLALVLLVVTQSNSHMGLKQLPWFSWEILLPTSRCHTGPPNALKVIIFLVVSHL